MNTSVELHNFRELYVLKVMGLLNKKWVCLQYFVLYMILYIHVPI